MPVVADALTLKRVLKTHRKVTVFDTIEECHEFAGTLGHTFLFPLQEVGVPVALSDPRRVYDVGELRWLSSPPGSVLFHLIQSDGRVMEIDYAQSCLRPLLRPQSAAAYGEFVQYLYKSYAARKNRLENTRRSGGLFRKIARIHVPVPGLDNGGRFDGTLRFCSLNKVLPLVELHGEFGVPWLSWLPRTDGEGVPLLFCQSEAGPDTVKVVREDALRRCREIIPPLSFPSVPHRQFVLIDPWGIRATSAWPHPPVPKSIHDCLLEIAPQHSASFLALLLQTAEGRPALAGLGRIFSEGDTSILDSSIAVPVPPLQKEYWIRLAHLSEFLGDMYGRLADRARSPFRSVLPENSTFAIPPLSSSASTGSAPSCADLSERMVREILSLPLSGLE